MKIAMTSVLVDDQEKALRFYTDVLGFLPKHDVPMGEHRWITVVSPEDPEGTELVLGRLSKTQSNAEFLATLSKDV